MSVSRGIQKVAEGNAAQSTIWAEALPGCFDAYSVTDCGLHGKVPHVVVGLLRR